MKVKDICTLQNGRAFKPEEWGTEGLPIIRIQNLNDENAPFNYYSGEYSDVHEINDGELLFSWSGTPGTSFGAFRWYRGKGVLNQHIFRVIPKIEIEKEYLKYALNGNISTIISKAHGGVGLQHITKKELDEIEIPVVSIDVQHAIVNNLARIEKIVSLRHRQINLLDDLIKARFVEMFGDMIINPNGWKKYNLGELCDVRDGTHDSPQYYNEGYPLVTSKNVTAGKIDLTDCSLICEEDYKKINQRSNVDYGDILMPMIGTVGNPVIVDIKPEFAIKNVALIKFYTDSMVLNTFVKVLLESDYFNSEVINKVRGGTQKFISLGDIRKLEICLPPLVIQKRFENYIAQIDKLKAAIQNALDEAQLLFDSLMQKYFI